MGCGGTEWPSRFIVFRFDDLLFIPFSVIITLQKYYAKFVYDDVSRWRSEDMWLVQPYTSM
jgi:hypothetical protein